MDKMIAYPGDEVIESREDLSEDIEESDARKEEDWMIQEYPTGRQEYEFDMLLKSTARNRGFQSNAKLISKTNHRKNTGSLSSRARIESQSQISKPDGTSGNTPVENSSTINSMGPKIKLYKPTAGQYTSRGRQEDSTDSKIRIGKESDSLKKASESGFRDSAH
jgi:hypothetical protein